MKKKTFFGLIGLLAVMIVVLAIYFKMADSHKSDSDKDPGVSVAGSVTPEPDTTTEEPTTEYVEPITITLSAVGDMLMHGGVSSPAVQADGSYNYDYLFDHVRDIIQGSDIAVVNEEVIFGGNELGIIGYPMFNVRTELGDALVNNGFDVVLHATNHTLDQHDTGVFNTINFWKNNHPDTSYLGIHDSAEDAAKITVKDVNGIKIAMLNYTYGLNGFEVPANEPYLVDLMTDANKDKIADDIARAKELSDFVVVYPHWGTEYNMGISDEQHAWAEFFAEQGVDLVIGTHPHVVEPVEWVESSNGHKMLVYYSLGNFVSIQYYNYSMLGGLAKVSITKDSTGTYVSNYDMDFLVTHYTSGRTAVTTYLLDEYTDELAASHAILTEPGPDFMAINQYYPFTVEGLKSLAKTICPDLAKY